MSISWAKYVPLDQVGPWLASGWTIRNCMAGTHHGAHAVLMIYEGDDPMPRVPAPPSNDDRPCDTEFSRPDRVSLDASGGTINGSAVPTGPRKLADYADEIVANTAVQKLLNMDERFSELAASGDFGRDVAEVLLEIGEMLLAKNRAYGDAALNPVRIFSKAPPDEQLLVRIDDKLSRLKRGVDTNKIPEDVPLDLTGYLILYRIALMREDRAAPKEYR